MATQKANERNAAPNSLQIFSYETDVIRTFEKNGEIWFVARDVCDILELNNITEALRGLDEEEATSEILKSGGQTREMKLISEPGLYSLIIRSNKPEAKKFRKWITSEILPSLRKTGEYRIETDEAESVEQIMKLGQPIYKDVLYYRFFKKLNQTDTAKMLGVSPNVLRKREREIEATGITIPKEGRDVLTAETPEEYFKKKENVLKGVFFGIMSEVSYEMGFDKFLANENEIETGFFTSANLEKRVKKDLRFRRIGKPTLVTWLREWGFQNGLEIVLDRRYVDMGNGKKEQQRGFYGVRSEGVQMLRGSEVEKLEEGKQNTEEKPPLIPPYKGDQEDGSKLLKSDAQLTVFEVIK